MRTLHLVRHAEAARIRTGGSDHDRALTSRGREDARRLGEHLRGTGVAPDLVLCSSARRARETLERIALPGPPHHVERRLYDAAADDLLARLREVADTAGVAVLVGHNPAVHELAVLLAGSGDDLERLAGTFPAGALATMEAPADRWAGLEPGVARLRRFVVPGEME